jgi:predicted ABC-type transport system involved in lysophospholipase L1 biosynthesis ATPase subunit
MNIASLIVEEEQLAHEALELADDQLTVV